MPLAVAMTSAIDRLDVDVGVSITVIDGGIKPCSMQVLHRIATGRSRESTVEFSCVKPPAEALPRLDGYHFANSAFNRNNYLRLALPGLLDDTVPRAVYLDCDVVVGADLRELVAAIPNDMAAVAVRDYGASTLKRRFGAQQVPGVGSDELAAPYFNSGVLGVNLERWRKLRISERSRELTEAHENLRRFADQDALNVALFGEWAEVDVSWNLQTGGPDRLRRIGLSEEQALGEPYEQIRKRAKIIHFTGNKPWEQGFTNPDRPAWVEALRKSGWFSPVGFRRWQASWWAKLVKRQAGKRWAHYRQRLTRSSPAGAAPVEQS